MSDHHDELVSAYLDGEATPEEVAQVEGDPALLLQVQNFRNVRLTGLGPVVPAGDVKERHLAAALAEFDSIAPVQQISARTRPERRVRWLSSVAAGALVLAGVGVALQQRGSGGDATDDVASGAADNNANLTETEMSRASDMEMAEEDAPLAESADSVEAGEVESSIAGSAALVAPTLTFAETPDAAEALAEAEGALLVPAAPDGSQFDVSDCSEALDEGDAPTAVVAVEAAGEPLVLYVFGEAGSYRAYLVEPSCEVVDRTP